jgi:hypothetical protein
MAERFWIHLLPWRRKNAVEAKFAQINFAPRLTITRDNGWTYLQLELVNRSNWRVWVEEASVVLTALNAEMQPDDPTGRAKHKLFRNVGPNQTLSVSLAETIYDAAGRPQGLYSCLVLTNVRYRVFDEWRNARLEPYRVEMKALTVVGLHSAGWYDKKIKTDGPVALTTKPRKD